MAALRATPAVVVLFEQTDVRDYLEAEDAGSAAGRLLAALGLLVSRILANQEVGDGIVNVLLAIARLGHRWWTPPAYGGGQRQPSAEMDLPRGRPSGCCGAEIGGSDSGGRGGSDGSDGRGNRSVPHHAHLPAARAADEAGGPADMGGSSPPDPPLAAGIAAAPQTASLGGGDGTLSERTPLPVAVLSDSCDSQVRDPWIATLPTTPHTRAVAVPVASANTASVSMGPFSTESPPPSVSLPAPEAESSSVAVDAPVHPPPPPPSPRRPASLSPPPPSEASTSSTEKIEWEEVKSLSRWFSDGEYDAFVAPYSSSESSSTTGGSSSQDHKRLRESSTAAPSGDELHSRGSTSEAVGAASSRLQRYKPRRRGKILPAATASRVAVDIAQLRQERLPFVAVAWDASNLSRVHALVVGPLETPYAGGLFRFDLYIPSDYPVRPPRVHLASPPPSDLTPGTCLHPHLPLRPHGIVEHPILDAATWSPAESLRGIILALQSLLSARQGHPELGVCSSGGERGAPAAAMRAGGSATPDAATVAFAGVETGGTPTEESAISGGAQQLGGCGTAAEATPLADSAVAAPSAGGVVTMGSAGPSATRGLEIGGSGRATRPADAGDGSGSSTASRGGTSAPLPPEVITDASSAAATATCLEWAVVAAVSPAALRASPLATPTVRAFLLFYDIYVAETIAGEAYERAHPVWRGGTAADAAAAPRWAALRSDLAQAHGRLLAAVTQPGWSFRRPGTAAAAATAPGPTAVTTAALVAEAAVLAADPPAGVVSAAPRTPDSPYVWDAIVTACAATTESAGSWEGSGGGGGGADVTAVVLAVEVVAAADHPETTPWVRFAEGSGVWHPNVSPVTGVPAVAAALGLGVKDGEEGEIPENAAVGTVGGTLAAVARLLSTPDSRWAVNAVAAAEHRLAPAKFWARFHRGGG
ncbi:hypothetical protein MMPV_003125 [Pyropia vietnamensis]